MKDSKGKRILVSLYHRCLDIREQALHMCTELYIRHCAVSPGKIVFDSFGGQGYGDNPKYLAEEIHRQGLDWDMVWLVRETDTSLPPYIRPVAYGSDRAKREIASAKVFVKNKRNGMRVPKKSGQIYLQTWHGGLGFKKVEAAVQEQLSDGYVKAAQKDGAECDAIVSACALQSADFRENFWLNPQTKILEFGQPRCDALFQNRQDCAGQKVRQMLSIAKDTGVILYAPTFRDTASADWMQLDFAAVLDAFERRYSKKYVIVIRLHPNVRHLCGCLHYDERIINGSLYPDIQELLLASDFLISDYSSAVFDFALLNKPVFLYLPDFESYRSRRGLSDVFGSCPFPKAYDDQQLRSVIDTFDHEAYLGSLHAFRDTVWMPFDDGNAAKRTVDWLKAQIRRG